nr:hypothetical protein Iba_chr07aCG6520 [Ipomoea batatas]
MEPLVNYMDLTCWWSGICMEPQGCLADFEEGLTMLDQKRLRTKPNLERNNTSKTLVEIEYDEVHIPSSFDATKLWFNRNSPEFDQV